MKKLIPALALAIPLIFSSCQSQLEPNEVLSHFLSALYEKDFLEAGKYATEESKEILILLEYGTRTNDEELDVFNPDKIEMGPARIKGNSAIIPVTENENNQKLTYTLVKVKNQWKVAFDNFPQAENTNVAPNDVDMEAPIDDVMDQLNEVNFDSLKKQVKKDLEKQRRP